MSRFLVRDDIEFRTHHLILARNEKQKQERIRVLSVVTLGIGLTA